MVEASETGPRDAGRGLRNPRPALLFVGGKVSKVDFLASEYHFFDHLLPVWDLLPSEVKGTFFIAYNALSHPTTASFIAKRGDITPCSDGSIPARLKRGDGPVAVASVGDLSRAGNGRPILFFEHGAGQSYAGNYASYAGATSRRDNVVAFLVPGEYPARRNRAAHPDVPCYVIGSPKLDAWLVNGQAHKPRPEKPVVCVSFHWDCRICPETRSTWNYYQRVLQSLAKEHTIIGHAHPRLLREVERDYRRWGIKVVPDFADVVEQADVYCCDNSSTLFEFAALGRPVVVLNAPWYRRHIQHGLRFWECANIGVQVNEPAGLSAAIQQAWSDAIEQQKNRQAAVNIVYGVTDGTSSQKAVEVIMQHLDSRHSPRVRVNTGSAVSDVRMVLLKDWYLRGCLRHEGERVSVTEREAERLEAQGAGQRETPKPKPAAPGPSVTPKPGPSQTPAPRPEHAPAPTPDLQPSGWPASMTALPVAPATEGDVAKPYVCDTCGLRYKTRAPLMAHVKREHGG